MDGSDYSIFLFESWRLDTRSRELRDADGRCVALTAKAFDTLHYLLLHRDRVVGKDELLAAVWSGRVVEENNLTQAVSAVRRALGTSAGEHRYLLTVPGRGYRFVAEAREEPAGAMSSLAPAPALAGDDGHGAAAGIGAPGLARHAFALAVVLAGLVLAMAAWRAREWPPAPTSAAVQATLAVLPFRSLTAGPRDELLELGMAETLSTRLERSHALRVRSLASVQRLQRHESDPLAIGRLLGATYVVEGSTQRIGDQVRVSARLLSVARGQPVWSNTFDASIGKVFTLQDDISDALTAALRVQPVRPALAPAACEGGDPDAYRALLRAQFQLQRRAPDTIAAFQDALRLDPACARGHAGLALAYISMAHNDRPPVDVFARANAAAIRALQIDPRSAEAQLARARYLQLHEWNWGESEAAMRRAIAINPSLADAHFGLAHLLVNTGRFDEGLAEARQARELDPLSPLINALDAGFFTAAGQPQAAAGQVARTLEIEPGFWIGLLVRGGLALDRGDAAAAVADYAQSAANSRRASQALAMLALADVAAGDRAGAAAILDELRGRARTGYIAPTSLAAVHLALGQRDAALDELERGYREHDIRIGFIGVDARWNALRSEPRFRALSRRLRLPEGPARGRY
ncbi:winged helix-turn-helix domain-containing protein [Luteimonas sp. 50]|uniref:Winged helix-turn-helix domain-containing protein n=1 Tax=Cognatiluteimonas sedimenti TaxID=2927791 RepID=A0ABT0A733_9GAMM|nr:winged helix-turn-helix domain-containing protein [Lysobacter sedimenti]MCJ0826786.1 winged helix-turn-helix domain-containing protein [Lysobacter sedimenti]